MVRFMIVLQYMCNKITWFKSNEIFQKLSVIKVEAKATMVEVGDDTVDKWFWLPATKGCHK